MKNLSTILTAIAIASVQAVGAAVTVDRPAHPEFGKGTSFAIVIDDSTYTATLPSLHRYRDAVEADGLPTYIVRSTWANPSEVREAIATLYKSDPTLEGIVLVGNIPVAMVRNGQHLTTAFKMDEDRYEWIESSVPSDRYYDCLDLSFRYVRPDSTHSHLHYYELCEDSPQQLRPTFYSARIRYPKLRGGDAYAETARFLDKAADAKTAMKQDDIMDRVVSFNGHGYNSDCLIAWMDEEKAYREHFPAAFKDGAGFRHWNFRMAPVMKYRIFDELTRPGTDLFMFHEHGAPTTQYINGYGEATDFNSRKYFFKNDIYYMMKRAMRKGKSKEEAQAALMEEYDLAESFFNDFDSPARNSADSAARADINIQANEFHSRLTMPRMVMFDACYNGSFHEDDYIAGEYLFNPGQTVVAQGNTRNVLQDRWTIEMIGLLSHGVRAGQYNALVATLEGHLMGDPTMHFTPIDPATSTISADMTLRAGDAAYWQSMLDSPHADIRSIALRKLSSLLPEDQLSTLLLETYKSSPFSTTRMEALKLLGPIGGPALTEAVTLAVRDPYERIARMAANMAGNIGDPVLLPAVIAALVEDTERIRVDYTLSNALSLFPKDDVVVAVNQYFDNSTRRDAAKEKEMMLASLEKSYNWAAEDNAKISDRDASESTRIGAARFVRNNPYHYEIDRYLTEIADSDNPVGVRVNMTEALGWFNLSHRKAEITAGLKAIASNPDTPAQLQAEITQTLRRLNP